MIKKKTYVLDSRIDGIDLPNDLISIISVTDLTDKQNQIILTQIGISDLLSIPKDIMSRHFIIADRYLYLFDVPSDGKMLSLRYNAKEGGLNV